MKTALILSGGGSKGAFSVGAIEVLRRKGYKFDMVAGTSTGSLIAPLVAIDDLDKMVEMYTTVKNSDVLRKNWRRLFWDGIADTTPLKKLIETNMLQTDRYDRLMKSPVSVLLCSVSLQSQAVRYYSQDNSIPGTTPWRTKDEFVRAVLGSTNQPVFMRPVDLGGEQLVDGGVREIAPINVAIDAGYERVIVVVNMPEHREKPSDSRYGNVLKIGLRALGTMATDVLQNDIQSARLRNEWYASVAESLKYLNDEQLAAVFGERRFKRPVELIIIRPDESLPTDGLTFEPEVMQEIRKIGQDKARKVINGLKT